MLDPPSWPSGTCAEAHAKTMSTAKPTGELILRQLQLVALERTRRAEDAVLANRVLWVKAFQQARFRATYADLLVDPRYRSAAEFFLNDLYGPDDFSERDQQFARVVPALVRLFPKELLQTVEYLAQLHALSERLDTSMGKALRLVTNLSPTPSMQAVSTFDATSYANAWRTTAGAPDRETQISLMLLIGGALDRYTRKPLLRQTLRLMRRPAHAAGLGSLQAFLETGFDTFREMRGADDFLTIIGLRERVLAAALFTGDDRLLYGRPD